MLAILAIESYRVMTRAGNRRSKRVVAHLIFAVLIGYGMLFAMNAAFGWVCLGLPDAAQSSWYLTLVYLFLAVLPRYLFLAVLPRIRARRILMGCIVLLIPCVPLRFQPMQLGWPIGKRPWVSCYLRTELHSATALRGSRFILNPSRTGCSKS